MTIKAGELITIGGSVLIDRLQSDGPSVNQNTTRITELGNYKGVDVIRDIPDLSFPLESFDVRPQLEAIVTGTNFAAMVDGDEIDLGTCKPLNVMSEFKRGRTDANPFNVAGSVIIPSLYMESFAWRYGLRDNATKTATLRGDSIHYNDASAYEQRTTGTATAGQTVALTHSALPYNGDTINGTRYAISVSLASGTRLFFGADYTETVAGAGQAKTVSVVVTAAVPVTDQIVITYFSPTVAVYPQASHAVASVVAPAGVRGRDIEVRVGGLTVAERWSTVQGFQANWRANLDRDEEFGNAYTVSQDFDVPDVTGSIDIKPRTIQEFISKLRTVSGVTVDNEVIGDMQQDPAELEVLVHSPVDGTVLETLYVPDAVFSATGYTGRVGQKLAPTLNWTSQGGSIFVYKGEKP